MAKVKIISRRRGSQSDPTHALAPVWACLRVISCAHARGRSLACGGLGPAVARMQHNPGERFNGPTRRSRARWLPGPRRGFLGPFLARFGALTGLWRMAGAVACAGAMPFFHCMNAQYWTGIQHMLKPGPGHCIGIQYWLALLPVNTRNNEAVLLGHGGIVQKLTLKQARPAGA